MVRRVITATDTILFGNQANPVQTTDRDSKYYNEHRTDEELIAFCGEEIIKDWTQDADFIFKNTLLAYTDYIIKANVKRVRFEIYDDGGGGSQPPDRISGNAFVYLDIPLEKIMGKDPIMPSGSNKTNFLAFPQIMVNYDFYTHPQINTDIYKLKFVGTDGYIRRSLMFVNALTRKRNLFYVNNIGFLSLSTQVRMPQVSIAMSLEDVPFIDGFINLNIKKFYPDYAIHRSEPSGDNVVGAEIFPPLGTGLVNYHYINVNKPKSTTYPVIEIDRFSRNNNVASTVSDDGTYKVAGGTNTTVYVKQSESGISVEIPTVYGGSITKQVTTLNDLDPTFLKSSYGFNFFVKGY